MNNLLHQIIALLTWYDPAKMAAKGHRTERATRSARRVSATARTELRHLQVVAARRGDGHR